MSVQVVFSAINGFWTNLLDWTLGAAPTSTEDAFIGAGASGAASVSSDANVVVNSIALNKASALTIDASSTFTATDGTVLSASDSASLGSGNAGIINVVDDSTLAIGDAFVNSGTVKLGCSSLADFATLSLIGDVTLSGGGEIDLGYQQGAAGTTANVTGGGLVNVDNDIAGAGTIALNSLDNRAGGVIVASQAYVDDLIIDVGQLSNEGLFEIAGSALLELGQNGQARTMTNSGKIEVGYEGGTAGSGAQLLIAGDFTISGAGAIDLMSKGAAISSDGTISTFTNAGAILATQSSQISDANDGYDDLTFINSGTTTATGAGVTLTLDTGSHTIGDSGVLEALNGATLTINSQVNIAGASANAAGEILVGAGGSANIAAAVRNTAFPSSTAGGVVVEAGGVLDIVSGGSVAAPLTIDGSSGATAGGVVNVQSGGSVGGAVDFASAGGTLNLAGQTAATSVTGAGAKINLTGAAVVLNGADDIISIVGGANNSVTIGGDAGGQADVVNGSKASLTLLADAVAYLSGNSNTVAAAAGAFLTVTGAGNSIQATNDTIVFGGNSGGAANKASGAGMQIDVIDGSVVTVSGGGNTITSGVSATLSVTGADNTIKASDDTLTVGGNVGGAADSVSGSGSEINVLANAVVAVTGHDNAIVAGSGATLSVTGVGDTIQAGDDTITLGGNTGGAADVVNGSGSQIDVLAGAVVTVNGSNDSIVEGAGAILNVTGASDTITIGGAANVVNGSGAEITLLASAGATVNGGDNVLVGGVGANLSVMGAGNTIQASDDTITIGGNSGGAADAVSGSRAHINVLADAVATVNGGDDVIVVAAGAALSVTGGGHTIQAANDTISLGDPGGPANVVNGTSAKVTVAAGSQVYLNGDGNAVVLDAGTKSYLFATGAADAVQASDDKIYVSGTGAGEDVVTGAGDRTIVAAGSNVVIDGANNYAHFVAGSSLSVTGTNERLVGAGFNVSAASGADFWIGGTGAAGAADVVELSNGTVRVGANSNIQLTGDDDTLAVRGNSNVTLDGAGLFTHFGRNAKVVLGGNGQTGALDTVTGAYFSLTVSSSANVALGTFGASAGLGDDDTVTVQRSNNTITAGDSDTISILWGDSNRVLLGANDVINDGGLGTVFDVGGNVGATTFNNFGTDSTGVIDLLNGVGGYATATDALAALTGDDAGGLKLSLGADGAVDFRGTTVLTAANFKIG